MRQRTKMKRGLEAVPVAPPLGRRAQRRAETRERIVKAALKLFARQGFSATTVEQITQAADVGKGTFFNYFPSKEHVLAGFGAMQLLKVERALQEAIRGAKPLRAAWKGLAHGLVRESGRSPSLWRGLLMTIVSSESAMAQMRQTLRRGREILARLIRKGQEGGEVWSDVDPAETARLFQQTMLGAMLLWSLDPVVELASWLDKTFDFFWAGVEAPKRAPGEGQEVES